MNYFTTFFNRSKLKEYWQRIPGLSCMLEYNCGHSASISRLEMFLVSSIPNDWLSSWPRVKKYLWIVDCHCHVITPVYNSNSAQKRKYVPTKDWCIMINEEDDKKFGSTTTIICKLSSFEYYSLYSTFTLLDQQNIYYIIYILIYYIYKI